jgi:hypothetical protein
MTGISVGRHKIHLEGKTGPDNQSGSKGQNYYAGVEAAILKTVAYADVFDYPLTLPEISRYLIGVPAPLNTIANILKNGSLTRALLDQDSGYVFLTSRKEIIHARQRRSKVAASRWPIAILYGKIIARLPFVRMVAVTGALAVDNLDDDADLDYLIITSPRRLWMCRAMIIALVRWARLFGDVICPNYFLTTRALSFDQRNLYTAHELAQMVPISGWQTYQQIRSHNQWSKAFLPNAGGSPLRAQKLFNQYNDVTLGYDYLRSCGEKLLYSSAMNWLEDWEMNRKIHKFTRATAGHHEIAFSPDWCKGHFEGHAHRTLAAFEEKIARLGIESLSEDQPC